MFELVSAGACVALGILVGATMARSRLRHNQLLESYAEYCTNVVDLLFKNDGAAAAAVLRRVSHATHRLELLDPHRESIVATGMLFGKCDRLVAALSDEDSGATVIARLRAEISAEYWKVVDIARERLGVSYAVERLDRESADAGVR
jgi:hypothetical protein